MTPQISVYNASGENVDVAGLVATLQAYVDHFLGPIWNVSAKLSATKGPVAGTWGFAFMDDADAPGALAYHTEADGLPMSKVFVRTITEANQSLSVAASHELAEMLVDPGIQMLAMNGDKAYAYEVCDAVEDDMLSFRIGGVMVSDFVTPAWFQGFNKVGPFSYCKAVSAPFQLAHGGYIGVWDGKNWSQEFGSSFKQQLFGLEDRRGHRSEYRSRK